VRKCIVRILAVLETMARVPVVFRCNGSELDGLVPREFWLRDCQQLLCAHFGERFPMMKAILYTRVRAADIIDMAHA
jgi:hypothetical protein